MPRQSTTIKTHRLPGASMQQFKTRCTMLPQDLTQNNHTKGRRRNDSGRVSFSKKDFCHFLQFSIFHRLFIYPQLYSKIHRHFIHSLFLLPERSEVIHRTKIFFLFNLYRKHRYFHAFRALTKKHKKLMLQKSRKNRQLAEALRE